MPISMPGAAARLSDALKIPANEIRYRGCEREREVAWNQQNWGDWLWWSLLSYGVGYGIGLRTFLVLIWVLVFSAIGALYLWIRNQIQELWLTS